MINGAIFKTIYTDIKTIISGKYMLKNCNICLKNKDTSLFYKRQLSCIECWNLKRRNEYKKSICGQCKLNFRPGVKGRYKFCSEKCRFMNKVFIDELTGCWNWLSSTTKTGYGTFVPIGQKSGLAHRSSYRIFKGSVPDDKFILHSCHRPICVAPDHLRIGTPMENTEDRKKAGRTTNHGKKLQKEN